MPTQSLTMGQFGRRFPLYAAGLVRGLGVAGTEEVHREIKPLVRALTPVGGVLTRDRHPGLMKKLWKTVKRPDGSYAEVNEAPYAQIINRGRKRGFTARGQKRVRRKKGTKVNKAARMLGSKQAPQGIRRPATKIVLRNQPAILRRIFSRADLGANRL